MKSIIIRDLLSSRLPAVCENAIVPFLDGYVRFFDHFVALGITDVDFVATFIMTNMVSHGHKNSIIVDAARSRFYSYKIVRLTLKYQHACLNADKRLKRIWVQIDAGKNLGML